jgi:hypothetical protein
MFAFITIFALPIFAIFGSYDYIAMGTYALANMWSLGNMGGAYSQCYAVQYNQPYASLECNFGVIRNFTAGVIPDGSDPQVCVQNITSWSESQFSSVNYDASCNSGIDENLLYAKIESECLMQKSCDLGDVTEYLTAEAFASETCYTDTTMMFVQWLCQAEDSAQDTRQTEGLIVCCINIVIALFAVMYIDYLKFVAKNNYIEYDVKTITAGDYSVEVRIPEFLY